MILKYILVLLTVLMVFIAKSQTNSVVIFSEKGDPFYFILNGDSVNKTLQSNIKAFDLSPGWQHIEIKMVVSNTGIELKDSILLSERSKFLNKEFTYALVQNEGKLKLAFKSVSEISGPLTPPVPIAPKETKPLVDNSIYGNLYQVKNNKPTFFNNYDPETYSCKTALNDNDLKYALNFINKSNSESDKYKNIQLILSNNCYTCLQLKQLLELTNIDMDRLNLTKEYYEHITDKQNHNLISSAFQYASMKESFATFLKEQEGITKQKELNCSEPVSNSKFDEIYAKIKSAGYENDKLAAAKKSLSDNCLSTEQTAKIAQLFMHDRELLDFLKYSYEVITDKVNAKNLANELQYSGSKEEFLNFIRKNEKH